MVCGHAVRQYDAPLADVGQRQKRNAGDQGTRRGVGIRRGDGLFDDGRVGTAQGDRHRKGIDADAEAGAEDGLIVESPGDACARRGLPRGNVDTGVDGDVAKAADEHLVRSPVIASDSADIAAHHWIVFVADADVHGEIARQLNPVADVEAEIPLAGAHFIRCGDALSAG